jgi:hypothetical protein
MARYEGRVYTNQYGNLVVSTHSKNGVYFATVRRPSDGYEVTIETLESSPMGAARYALSWLADVWRNPSAKTKLRSAADKLGRDASEALDDYESLHNWDNPELSGAYDEGSERWREGEVWFQVIHEPKDVKPGQWIKMPFRGRKFRTLRDAEEALKMLLEQGTIRPEEKHLWGVEQVRQGKGRTEVYHVRVS